MDFTSLIGATQPIKMSHNDYLNMQDKRYNESTGSLTGYNCQECNNRGYFQYHDAEGYQYLKECKCMQMRRNYKSAENSGMIELLSIYKFETYTTNNEWQSKIKESAKEYCSNSDKEWFYISGESGCGKTHICTAICNHYIRQGREIKYLLWKDIHSKLESTKYNDAERTEFMNQLKKTDIIYIDDFLKTQVSEEKGYATPQLQEIRNAYDVINARYIGGRKTIISSELFLNELKQIDTATSGRIIQRCGKYNFNVNRDESRNYRLGV